MERHGTHALLRGDACLERAVGIEVVGHEEALGHQAPQLVHRAAGLRAVGALQHFRLILLVDTVLGIGEVAVGRGEPVAVPLLVEVEGHLHTVVGHLSEVSPGSLHEAALRGHDGALHEDVLTLLLEDVEVEVEHVPESQLQADVLLGHGLPCEVAHADVTLGDAAVRALAGGAPGVALLTGVECAEVGKAASADVVVASLTDGGAQLDLVEDGLQPCHEGLLAEQPADGERGEESEALALGEVLRSVVAEVELSHVAVVVGGREAAGDALLAVVLYAAVVVGLLVVEQEGVDVGLAEAAVVHQVGLEVDT